MLWTLPSLVLAVTGPSDSKQSRMLKKELLETLGVVI